MNAKRHPIDFDGIQKGSYIPADELEDILGLDADSATFNLVVLEFSRQIADELEIRGRPATVIIEDRGIRVLTDAESSSYNARRFVLAQRQMFEAHSRSQRTVELRALTPEQQKDHVRRLEIQGRYLQGLVGVRKQLQIEAHKRDTPGLPPGGAT